MAALIRFVTLPWIAYVYTIKQMIQVIGLCTSASFIEQVIHNTPKFLSPGM